MNYKKILNYLLLFSGISILTGVVLMYPENFGICSPDEKIGCIYPLGDSYGQPLAHGFLFLIATFLLLRFLPLQVFKAWFYFAAWYVPLAAAWIVITPAQGGHFLSPDKEGLTWLLGGVYLGISLLIILIRSISLKFSKRSQ